jgi:hypothetical protein
MQNLDVADDINHSSGLHRTLSVRDLTFFGVAAIIGAALLVVLEVQPQVVARG